MRYCLIFRYFLVFAVLGLASTMARGEYCYFMIVFASEGELTRQAHTFATFIKASDNGEARDGYRGSNSRDSRANWLFESHTISWMPATLDIRLIRRPEAGRNLNLGQSLELARSIGARVTAWGPYRIRKELYERALEQITRLESGAVAYKALDGRFRPDIATNCFHAVSDIVDGELLNTGTAYGEAASRMVANHLRPWIIDPWQTHEWLLKRLHLDKLPISFEKLAGSGAVTEQRPASTFFSRNIGPAPQPT
jgi:hypothetical protein